MKRIILTEYITLDGVIENPAWTAPYWGDDIARYKFDELFSCDTLLLGRVTYQGFAASWPSQSDEQGFAVRMNNLPKYVVSTTLQSVDWNNSHIIREHILEEIRKLKQQSGQDILLYGSGTLANTLMEHNLIDEYRLLVYPLILGSGKRLFQNGGMITLKQSASKTFSSGVIALTYQAGEQ